MKVTAELAGAYRGRVFFVEVNEEETEVAAATEVTKRMLCLCNSLWVQSWPPAPLVDQTQSNQGHSLL